MEIPLDRLVAIVVSRVMAELARQGVTVTGAAAGSEESHAMTGAQSAATQESPASLQAAGHGSAARHDDASLHAAAPGTRLELDFEGYKTPVLNEHRVRGAGPHIREIVVPARTIVTAGARDLIEQRRLKLTFTSTHS